MLRVYFFSLFLSSSAFASSQASDYFKDYSRPPKIPFPDENQYSKEREELGKMLFFDPRLSKSDWISCATCHNPALSWGDGLPKGLGHGMKPVARRTPTILNLAWGELFFWDGRASTLEEQALGPISAAGEMNLPLEQMVDKLKAVEAYRPYFEKAYPGQGINKDTVAMAIATFERTIVSAEAQFDRWIKGDNNAVSASAMRGFVLFNEKAQCSKCHSGWRFTDDSFHDIGVDDNDRGRAGVLEGIPVLEHAFKTPTLRNVAHRAPYMHDGSEPSLEKVVEFYNNGGRVRRKYISEHIVKLKLSKREQQDLVSFLETLTSQDEPVQLPMLPR